MIDVIKKTLLAGIGATVVTKEKIEAGLQHLVSQGKVSAKEAGELAAKIAEDGRREFESAGAELSERVRELLAKANFANKAQVEALEARVKKLEALLTESAD